MNRLPSTPLLLLVGLLLVPLWACTDSEVDGASVIHTTASGIDLSGTYRRPSSSERQPTLLLLHETGFGHSRHDFDDIWDSLTDAGYGLVAPDLRSHGLSDPAGALGDLRLDPDGYPEDVRGWLGFISDRAEAGDPLDRSRVGIVGLGTSASLGAAALGKGYVNCAVSLSPSTEELNAFEAGFPREGEVPAGGGAGDDDDSAEDGPAILTDNVELHSVRWMASVGDEPSATDLPALYESTAEPRDLVEEGGAFHALELLQVSEDNQRAVIEWCLEIL
ncbi:MAG: alpha/beta fold hydrolase [Myxococcota bacterium]|nr:alpha/beta fold hydrolase [Myxococcota bacterium]